MSYGIVERVTEAILSDMERQAHGDDPCGKTLGISCSVSISSLARAAIEAMREPTEAMIKAGEDAAPWHEIEGYSTDDSAVQWRAMIDEAIK